MKKYSYTKQLNISDVGFNFKPSASHIMELFQQAVTMHTLQMGVDGLSMQKLYNAKWFIVSAHFEFHKMPKLYDTVTVHTWPLKPSAAKFPRAFVLQDENGEKLVSAMTQWCTVKWDSGELVPTSAIKMPFDDFLEQQPTDPRCRIPKTECDKLCYTRKMMLSDIDMNMHVNNVSYIRMALDCFTSKELENIDMKTFDIQFKNQCFEGDTVSLYRADTENGVIIDGKTADTDIFSAKIN